MKNNNFLKEADRLQGELVESRRYLHKNAETGFELNKTIEYVENKLKKIGYSPIRCGKAGICATVQGAKDGSVFLLRADMDALPIKEESDVEFTSDSGNMHACGHDMHTAMLLGAAKLLKQHENELCGTVKLMFQPAEETFEGSLDMIQNGILENPKPDAALMIHVMANSPFKTGTVVVSSPGVSAPAADYFEIKVQGRGCHGSMPNAGVDPISVASHIVLALQEINARELSVSEKAVLTIGAFHSGTASNAIPDTAVLGGTVRTYDEETRSFIKTRIKEISESVAKTFRASAEVTFGSGCPTLINDKELSQSAFEYTSELLGNDMAFTAAQLESMASCGRSSKSAGSEDFAYISQKVPSIMLALSAGQSQDGYCYPQHHPKVTFDENALITGCAVYAYTAIRWLEEH